ncbi:hypothetical protein HK102_004456, partial [Quaeritorhiza haematococci]
MAAHLIPTVERESIDFVDRTLNTWNQELLCMGGLLARIIYEDEMSAVSRMWAELSLDPDSETWLQKRGAHAMQSFHFRPSTPSSIVGRILASLFLKLSTRPLSVISTKGVLPVNQVRLPDPKMAGFIKNVPLIPELVLKKCDQMMKQMEQSGVIRRCGLPDVFTELSTIDAKTKQKRSLTNQEAVELFRWWIDYRRMYGVSHNELSSFLELALLNWVDDPDSVPNGGAESAAVAAVTALTSSIASTIGAATGIQGLDSSIMASAEAITERMTGMFGGNLKGLFGFSSSSSDGSGSSSGTPKSKRKNSKGGAGVGGGTATATANGGMPGGFGAAGMGGSKESVAGAAASEKDKEKEKEKALPKIPLAPPRALKDIKTFVTAKNIPPGFPLPEHTLAMDISKHFSKTELESFFGGWTELNLADWAVFICEHESFEEDPAFTEKVLAVFSRAYGSLNLETRARIVSVLSTKRCIPTVGATPPEEQDTAKSGTATPTTDGTKPSSSTSTAGSPPASTSTSLTPGPAPAKVTMRHPHESYFKNVTLFSDLPQVSFAQPRSISDVFLKALGVREHVDLQMVFDRLDTTLQWDHIQLVKYLSGVSTKLTDVEIERLRVTPLFVAEGKGAKEEGKESTEKGDANVPKGGGEAGKEVPPPPPVKRYKASDLYNPSDVLRELGLPLIDWKGKWRSTSEEAKFLHALGLRTHIPVDDLVKLAGPGATPDKRAKVLNYFVENFRGHYAGKYRANLIKVPFLPCIVPTATTTTAKKDGGDGIVLATPLECFAEAGCLVMGDTPVVKMKVLHADWKAHADKFGVRMHPPPEVLVQAVRAKPPEPEKAAGVFGYLATRQGDFSIQEWRLLRESKIVPIVKSKLGDTTKPLPIIWLEPTRVYFGGASTSSATSSFFADQFDYIDFGPAANAFLRSCGVKDEPTPPELASQLVRNPKQFLEGVGFEGYLTTLRQLAAHYHVSLKTQPKLLQEMKSAAFLIGIKSDGGGGVDDEEDDDDDDELYEDAVDENGIGVTKKKKGKKDDSGSGGGGGNSKNKQLQFELARARDVYLIDDPILQQIFMPLGCPMESLLEEMYYDLGSRWLSKQVKEVYQPRGSPRASDRCQKLENLIRDRAPLLLYDGGSRRTAPGAGGSGGGGSGSGSGSSGRDVVENAEKILRGMQVLECPDIDILREFEGRKHAQRTGACMMVDKRANKYYLFVSGDFDYFDVASALCTVIFRKTRLNDRLLLSTLLSTSLANLKRKGFPVDRVLNLQASRLREAQKVKEAQERFQREEEEKRRKLEEEQWKQREAVEAEERKRQEAFLEQQQLLMQQQEQQMLAEEEEAARARLPPISNPQVAAAMQHLMAIFPDADPEFLLAMVEAKRAALVAAAGGGKKGAAAAANGDIVQAVTDELLELDYPKVKPLPRLPPPNAAVAAREAAMATPGSLPPSSPSSSSSNSLVKSPSISDDAGRRNSDTRPSSDVQDERNGLFGRLSNNVKKRGWGQGLLDTFGIANAGGNGTPTNPQAESQNQQLVKAGGGGGIGFGGGSQGPMQPATSGEVTPEYTNTLQSHLKKSLSTLQTSGDTSFRAQVPSDPVRDPPAVPVQDASTRCALLSDADLVLADTVEGIKFYVDKSASPEQVKAAIYGILEGDEDGEDDVDYRKRTKEGAKRFAAVLKLLASVFE